MTIAIIGAGAAGLSAGLTLRTYDMITLYEKSHGRGGRVATRWHDLPDGQRVYVDHGAQYLRDETPEMHRLMKKLLPIEELNDIARPVWTFDAANQISAGDRQQNEAPKWSYSQGLGTFGKMMVKRGSLQVRGEVRIGKLAYADGLYALFDTDNNQVGNADRLVIAIPAEQAADLIAASDLPAPERLTLETALRAASYRRCLSVTLGFDRVLTTRQYYALINSDKAHPLSWLAFEHDKPGHVPPGHSVLVAQMAGAYSLEHWEMPGPELIAEVAAMVSELIGEDVKSATWSDTQRWRYSQPETLVAASNLNGVLKGLWFAGDYTLGGRVHLAVQSGIDAGLQIAQTY